MSEKTLEKVNKAVDYVAHGTSIGDVAIELEVSPSTVYYYLGLGALQRGISVKDIQNGKLGNEPKVKQTRLEPEQPLDFSRFWEYYNKSLEHMGQAIDELALSKQL